MFVDDGDTLTSAGGTAGIDLCLHLIRIDHGAAASNARARLLVVPPQRPGGQAQYIDQLRSRPSSQELATVRGWMLDNMAAMITRRRFRRTCPHGSAHLGPPLSQRDRDLTHGMADGTHASTARELLEATTEPIERIGRLAGLGNPASVRAAFHRRVGTSPQEYRALFGQKARADVTA